MIKLCPNCATKLETREVSCHSCGAVLTIKPLTVADVAPHKEELEDAYRGWFEKGKACLKEGQYDEAANCLREAIKRSRPLDGAQDKEIDARKCLAEALEKRNKLQEAADQYRIIAQDTHSLSLRDSWLKKSQDLVAASSSLPYDRLFKKEEFRAPFGDELKFVPLYCVGCKRLLAEAEVYGFRRGNSMMVRCWCGIEGKPLAKDDGKHSQALVEARQSASQRSRAVALATRELPGGKRKSTAILLALTTGFIGGHKFYLGEITVGWIYAFWFWTFIPMLVAIYEAIVLAGMNQTTFNMTYNIELVLAMVEPSDEKSYTKADVFSMNVADESAAEKTITLKGPFARRKNTGETAIANEN